MHDDDYSQADSIADSGAHVAAEISDELVRLAEQERANIYETFKRELLLAAIRCNRIHWRGGVVFQIAEVSSEKHWRGTRTRLSYKTVHAFPVGVSKIRSSASAPIGYNTATQDDRVKGIYLTQDGQLYDEARWFTYESRQYHGLQDAYSYPIDKVLLFMSIIRSMP